MNENEDVLEIIESGLLGFATADALGVPVEFTTRGLRESDPVSDMRGNGTYPVPEGTWSDDTSMTIATMDSIRESEGINYEDIMDKYCDWVFNSKYTATDQVFDVGRTTGQALDNYYKTKIKAVECGGREDSSNGNGSLMRMLPIVYYLHYSDLDENTKTEIIDNYSSLTHAHEISKLGCRIYYDYMDGLLSGLTKEEAYDKLKYKEYPKYYSEDSILKYERVLDGTLSTLNKEEAYDKLKYKEYPKYYSEDSILKYERILNGNLGDLFKDEIKSTGYVVDTLEAAIWCNLTSNSYEEAVVKAVNLGDDTDTVGAVTGSIAGTIYGLEAIPERWISKVRKLDELKSIATGYCSVVCDNNENISYRFIDPEVFSSNEELYEIVNKPKEEEKNNIL